MQVLGIHFDKPFLKIALVEKSRRRDQILYFKSFPIDEIESVKQLYSESFKGSVCSGLPASDIFIKSLETKSCSPRHLEQVLSFQSDALLHFDSSEIISFPYIIDTANEKTNLLLFTCMKETIRQHLLEMGKYRLDPDCITAVPLALIHFAQWKKPDLQDAFIVDLGSQEWTCVCMEKGKLKKLHFVEGGMEALLSALWEDRKKILFPKEIKGIAKQIDLLQLKSDLNVHLSTKLHAMKLELAKIIYSFSRLFGSKPILFTGRFETFGHMREYLMEEIKDCISQEIEEFPKEEKEFAAAIGMAVGYGSSSLQFRKGDFFPKKHWKKAGIYALCLFLFSFLISGSIVTATHYGIKAKKHEMISTLHNALLRWDPIIAHFVFSSSDEEEILRKWGKLVSSHCKDFPYLIQAPKVAETLSWLYQHPVLIESKEEKDPIEILSFRYLLAQYPKIGSPKEPYQAKVELQFKTKSSLLARKFHEYLLQEDAWVDNTLDIQWEVLENVYCVSFYLKKEDPHVS